MTRHHAKVRTPPQPYTVSITGLSHEGRGIASANGKVKFLRGGLPGETVTAVDLKKHRSYDEGVVTDVLQASAQRVEPPCPHTHVCGGCALQHFDPEQQILFKQQTLLEQLQHIAGVVPENILPPLTSPSTGYRHKARLGVKYVAAKQKVLVGFRELNGRYLADIDSCAVLHPSVGKKLTVLSGLIASLAAYQSIPQIEVAVSDNRTALIFRHLQPLSDEDRNKLVAFAQQEDIDCYLQPGGINTVCRLWPASDGRDLLQYTLPNHRVSLAFHPSHFTQINPIINRSMVDRAIELLNPQPYEKLLDLFCGLGNFTLPLARYCADIIGVEGEPALVALAEENAKRNQITNAKFYTANLASDFSTAPFLQAGVDKVLIDPPRTGALEAVKILPILKPKVILYVSCNPSTLARDTKELLACGYRLTHAGVMDMFPHTSHVESMALFERL